MSDSPVLPCRWVEDPDGSRYLVPGCWTRLNNPDIDECSCAMLNERNATLQEKVGELEEKLASLQCWYDHVVRAVYDHRDGIQIMKTAAQQVESA